MEQLVHNENMELEKDMKLEKDSELKDLALEEDLELEEALESEEDTMDPVHGHPVECQYLSIRPYSSRFHITNLPRLPQG